MLRGSGTPLVLRHSQGQFRSVPCHPLRLLAHVATPDRHPRGRSSVSPTLNIPRRSGRAAVRRPNDAPGRLGSRWRGQNAAEVQRRPQAAHPQLAEQQPLDGAAVDPDLGLATRRPPVATASARSNSCPLRANPPVRWCRQRQCQIALDDTQISDAVHNHRGRRPRPTRCRAPTRHPTLRDRPRGPLPRSSAEPTSPFSYAPHHLLAASEQTDGKKRCQRHLRALRSR
jgi:hypothetical protein